MPSSTASCQPGFGRCTLIPLGQTDGQRVLVALDSTIATPRARAHHRHRRHRRATPRADIAECRHENAVYAAVPVMITIWRFTQFHVMPAKAGHP